jgi:hypothetical protein
MDDGGQWEIKFDGYKFMEYADNYAIVSAYQSIDDSLIYVQEVTVEDDKHRIRVFRSEDDFFKYVAENGYESGFGLV